MCLCCRTALGRRCPLRKPRSDRFSARSQLSDRQIRGGRVNLAAVFGRSVGRSGDGARPPSQGDAMQLRRSRSVLAVLMTVAITAMMVSCTSTKPTSTNPQAGVNAGTDGKPAPFREPVRLSSKDGVLEVRLSAHQGTVNLDTVKEPVSNFLVFGYDLIKGTSSDGSTKGDNLYPAPTLRVDPGQRLIVHFDNDLSGLTIDDFNDPAQTPTGGDVPIYPPALRSAPLNLHTHGLHVSPSGNADNVLLSIPAGMGNTYDYAVPSNMPNGLYWYHTHW